MLFNNGKGLTGVPCYRCRPYFDPRAHCNAFLLYLPATLASSHVLQHFLIINVCNMLVIC